MEIPKDFRTNKCAMLNNSFDPMSIDLSRNSQRTVDPSICTV